MGAGAVGLRGRAAARALLQRHRDLIAGLQAARDLGGRIRDEATRRLYRRGDPFAILDHIDYLLLQSVAVDVTIRNRERVLHRRQNDLDLAGGGAVGRHHARRRDRGPLHG